MTNESKSPEFSPVGRERAIGMVYEHHAEHTSQRAAINSIYPVGADGEQDTQRTPAVGR